MNRRQFFANSTCLAAASSGLARASHVAADETIYVNARTGVDSNPGTKGRPIRTLSAAAARINGITEAGPNTIVLEEGVYAVSETAVFKPTRAYTRTDRLSIRAAVLPDDPDWHTGKMPTLIHTMPLSKEWLGRPDPFGGVAYGMQIETSHVTIQGLKILGMPIVEHPEPRAIHRVYAIGRNDDKLDDLEIKQCLFAGDEVTNPSHLPILVRGTGLVLDHCLFYNVKQPVVYWTPGSTGHAMRNCLIHGSYACSIWTSGIANDLDYRNNIVSSCNYVWIAQGARSSRAETGQTSQPPAGAMPAQSAEPVHYRVRDSFFAGNKKYTGSGAGPALNFRDIDPSFLELIDTKVTEQPILLELDQTKRNYLHPVAVSDAARIGAGLFTKPAADYTLGNK
jgi:hypothetical protein